MKKLILFLLLIPFLLKAQFVNGTIQLNNSTKTIRYLQGTEIDSIAAIYGTAVNGYILQYDSTLKKFKFVASSNTPGLADSLLKKANKTFDNVASGAIANAKLANSSVTIGSTNIALGATSTTLAGLSSITSTFFVGALTGNATTSTTASNLAGGSGGTIPYQSAAGTTAMLANGTAGYILQSNGTTVAPTWVNPALGTGYIDNQNGSTLAAQTAKYWITDTIKTSGKIIGSTFTGAGTGLTGTAASLTAGAIVSQANSATITASTASTGGTISLRDGSGNITTQNILSFTTSSRALTADGSGLTANSNFFASNLSGTNTGDQTITLTGDVTGSGTGSFATTLATVNASPGTYGSATQTPVFVVNGKGLVTSNTNTTITPAVGSITGLGTGVATALGVNTGSAGAFVTFNGNAGTPSALVGTNISGTASNLTAGVATNVTITANTNNATWYIPFAAANTTSNYALGIGANSPTINPSNGNIAVIGTLSATTFTGAGTGLTGTAASLTAGNATNVATTDNTATNAFYFPTFVVASSGNNPITVSSTKLTYKPSSGLLTAVQLQGGTTSAGANVASLNVVNSSNTTNTGSSVDFYGSANGTLGGQLQYLRTNSNSTSGNTGNGDMVGKATIAGSITEVFRGGFGGFTVPGLLTGLYFKATGGIASAVASTTQIGYSSGSTIISTGPDASTNGNYTFSTIRSDGSNQVNVLTISAGGNGVFTGTIAGTGANFSGLTASQLVQTDGSKNLISSNTLPASITLTTPVFSGVPTGTVTSGTYTPTFGTSTNTTAGTSVISQYKRIGNIVTVYGKATGVTSTLSVASRFTITLPIASNLTSVNDLLGNGNGTGTVATVLTITGDTTGDIANIDFTSPSAALTQDMYFSFSYIVQ